MQLFNSLRSRIVGLIVAALLPGILLAVFVAIEERGRAYSAVEQNNLIYMRLAGQSLGRVVSNTNSLFVALAQLPQIRNHDAEGCRTFLKNLIEASPDYRGAAVVDATGSSWCYYIRGNRVLTSTNNVSVPYLQRALTSKQFFVDGVSIGNVTGRPNLRFVYPLIDAQNKVQTILTLSVDADALNNSIDRLKLPTGYVVDVLDRNGAFVVRWPTPDQYVGKSFPEAPITKQILTEGRDGHERTTFMVGVEDTRPRRLYTFSSVLGTPDNDLFVSVGIAPEVAYAPIDASLMRNLVALGVFAVLSIVGGWVLSDIFITRRTRALAYAAQRLSAGDKYVRTGLAHGNSELDQLARAFDAMSERLQAASDDLERRVVTRTQQLQASNAKLLEFQAELRNLSSRQNEAVEEERKRMAREVHDQIGQALTSIKMDLSSAQRKLNAAYPANVPVLEKIHSALGLADETIQIARRISADLRPGILDNLGLEAAVDWQLREFEKRSGVTCALDIAIDEAALNHDISIVTFRILQEALTNVARHAEAKNVRVQLEMSEDALTLQVQDDGKGIADEKRMHYSNGVLGMRERALRLKGTVHLSSLAGKGTTMMLTLPLKPEPAGADAARNATLDAQRDARRDAERDASQN